MGLTAKDSGGGDFTPAPEGTHIARCIRVIDLGTQPGSAMYPEPKHKILIAWEIPGETIKVDGEERPALLQSRYTCSLHKRAKLRADLESWRGRAFSDEELKGFHLKALLGVGCMVTVVHSPDGKYANVRSVTKLPKGIECPRAYNDLQFYEIEDGDSDTYRKLSPKMQALIAESEEWKAKNGVHDDGYDAQSDDTEIPF